MPVRRQCPVAMRTRQYTTKSDVYSFGVFLYEVCSGGGTPYRGLQAAEVLAAVAAGQRLAQPSATTSQEHAAGGGRAAQHRLHTRILRRRGCSWPKPQ